MSGRHSTPAGRRPKLAALPDLVGQAARLAPRQLNDELALAKIELKNRGVKAGVGAGLFVVALLFLGLLVIALVVAAILGLATVMPGWLAALIVGAAFLVIIAIAVLIGMAWVKKAMPLVPADAIRGVRYDLGIVTEGRNFDPRLLDPSTIQYKRAQATKEAEKAKAKMEKEAQERAHGKVKLPAPTEAELRERLEKRRAHLLDVRDGLVAEMDVKRQAGYLADDVKARFAGGSSRAPFATTGTTARGGPGAQGTSRAADTAEALKGRWAPLAVFTVSATAFVVFLRKLVKN
ncbi:phage holin family protein [Sinomonas sp. ASV486]|uniref:Phage holin family protein n=1 Tax=Sinomonas puerhi TaxID=3238584 RepID=A0AB39L8I0_9MICC|nr:phage holin family protein [Sinomonas sp. ASV486]MDQ4490445.1 phage holin family protein [Sinomonas sp. ASV486]